MNVRRYCVRHKETGKFCSLNLSLHDLGLVIPDKTTVGEAHVFKTNMGANAAIARTILMQKEVLTSLLADWPKFNPLRFTGSLEPVEVQLTDKTDPYHE